MKLVNLIEIGVKPDLEFYQKRETRIVNLFSLITLVGLLVGVSTILFISGDYVFSIVLFSTLSSISILLLNYKARYELASKTFVVTISITMFVLNQSYNQSVGNNLYYFPIIFCVALLHNPSKSNYRTALFFLIILISFICSITLSIPYLKNTTITNADNEALLKYNGILAFAVTLILVYMLVKLINNQNNDTLELLKKQKESQRIIAESLKEKVTLLAEIQHRVKNNLAIIVGLLNLQTEKAPCEVSKNLMIDSRNRVMSMAMVHQRLYKRNDISKIDIKQYLSDLVNELVSSFPQKHPIQINEQMDTIELELTKALPAGLIVNEIITNILKHAFTDDNLSPIITLKIRKIFDKIQIVVSDNGVGIGEFGDRKESSLGISLIESLADQIDANVTFKNNNGTSVNLILPI